MKRHVLALAAAGAFLLAGCGGEPSAAPTSAAPSVAATGAHNATDVMFLQMLLAHEAQAVTLTDAATRAGNAEVRTLAAAIAATQATEAETMTGWLRAWGEPTTAAGDASAHAGHGGGLHMLSPADLATLDRATGADFDRQLVALLVAHQHNAVELAQMELKGGTFGPARDFAERVRQSRTAQVAQLLPLIG